MMTLETRPAQAGAITNERGPEISVRPVTSRADWHRARALMLDFFEWIRAGGLDVYKAQPALRDEVNNLSAWYTPPRGVLFLAKVDTMPAGHAAIYVVHGGVGELRRIYVRPAARGYNLGERLIRAAMDAAVDLGCHTVRLETVPGMMDHAIDLYRRLGFEPARSIGYTHHDGVLSMARPLIRPAGSAA